MSKQIVSVGRIVHYTSFGSAPQDGVQLYPSTCRAAIVTEVVDLNGGIIHLTVFNPEGMQLVKDCPFDYGMLELNGPRTVGRWHWPEKTVAPLAESGAEPKEL
jgi:hypothetical protein